MTTTSDILDYESQLLDGDKLICITLRNEIEQTLPGAKSKIWHGHPVWFIDENPIVGYSKLKNSVQLLFWSGNSFEERELSHIGKFQAAEKRYTNATEVNISNLNIWLRKSRDIQWDYINIVKNQGKLERLK